MSNNNELVFKGFRHLLKAFAPYICALLKIEYGTDWWRVAVMGKLWDEQKRDLPEDGPEQMLVDSLDIQRCLILFDLYWGEVFRKRLSIDHRTWAKELVGVRNKLAHIGAQDFNDSDTWRALDTMSRLCWFHHGHSAGCTGRTQPCQSRGDAHCVAVRASLLARRYRTASRRGAGPLPQCRVRRRPSAGVTWRRIL